MTVVEEPTLAELARRANEEHGQVVGELRSALSHALTAGDALAQAKDRAGNWPNWCKKNLRFDRHTANWYIRMHRYRGELAEGEVSTVSGAMRYLREHELSQRISAERKREVVALLDEGLPQYQVGEKLGISQSSVNRVASVRKSTPPPPKPRWITHRRPRTRSRWDRAYDHFRQALAEIDDLAENDPKYAELYEHLHWVEDFFRRQMRGRHTGKS